MPKAGKGKLRIICAQCGQEKLAKEFCSNKAKTCTDCNTQPRTCGGCHHVKPAKDFAKVWSRHCQACNSDKETAEHVDVCESEGCDTAFARNPDSFTWKKRGDKGNWESKCKECCAFKGYDRPTLCNRCNEVKKPEEFNKSGICKPCRKAQSAREAAAKGATRTKETARRPVRCSQPGCGKLFTEDAWRQYRQGEGRWDAQCRVCYNGKRYHVASTERRLAADPEGYKTHTAEVSEAWRIRARADVDATWRAFERQAARAVPVKTIQGDEVAELKRLLLLPCGYCGYSPSEGAPLNTLDRVDNKIRHYNLDNVVTCCNPCNRIKGCSTEDDFLERAWQEASMGGFNANIDRLQIDSAYRSFHNRNPDGHAESAFYHEQMCFVARHSGYEF